MVAVYLLFPREHVQVHTGHVRNGELDLAIAGWCLARAARGSTRVIGINGPQGCGKSTLAALLVDMLAQRGVTAIAVSIDDFYLTHAEQRALAAAHPGNRTLEHRGYPGTHDVALGTSTLDSLIEGRATSIPSYDKTARGSSWRATRSCFRLRRRGRNNSPQLRSGMNGVGLRALRQQRCHFDQSDRHRQHADCQQREALQRRRVVAEKRDVVARANGKRQPRQGERHRRERGARV